MRQIIKCFKFFDFKNFSKAQKKISWVGRFYDMSINNFKSYKSIFIRPKIFIIILYFKSKI
jgi:hypothetical protein